MGINDYWSVDGYSRVKEQFERGNLPDVDLVVPVVEMRLTDSISNKQKQNYHVCFDPSISTDVIKQYFLSKLESSFKFPGGQRGPFALGDPGFIALGQQLVETGAVEAQNSAPTQAELLDIGRKQFAVDLTAVRQLLDQEWFKARTMEFVGYSETKHVPNSGHEGLAKQFLLNADGAFLASLNATSFHNNREKLSKLNSGIPLIHASDAHRFNDGGEETRYLGKSEMWVRCSPNFESLQFAIKKFNDRLSYGEPEDSKRKNGITGNVIGHLYVKGPESGELIFDYDLELNPGYVVIVGNRGMGKSALADWLAIGVTSDPQSQFGFLNNKRFRPAGKGHDSYSSITRWRDGSTIQFAWKSGAIADRSRVDYFPQFRIEELCSADPSSDSAKILEDLIGDLLFHRISSANRRGKNSLDELKNDLRQSTQTSSSIPDFDAVQEDVYAHIKRIKAIDKYDLEQKKTQIENEIQHLQERTACHLSADHATALPLLDASAQHSLLKERVKAWTRRRDQVRRGLDQLRGEERIRDQIKHDVRQWFEEIEVAEASWHRDESWDSTLTGLLGHFEQFVDDWFVELSGEFRLIASRLRRIDAEMTGILEGLDGVEEEIRTNRQLENEEDRDRERLSLLKNGETDPAQDLWTHSGILDLEREKAEKMQTRDTLATRLAEYAVRTHHENVEAASLLASLLNDALADLSLGDGSVGVEVKIADRFSSESFLNAVKATAHEQAENLCAERAGFDGARTDLSLDEVNQFIQNVIAFVSEAEDKVWLKKTAGALDGFGCLRLLTDFSSFDIRIELALNGKPLAQLSPGQRGLVLLLFILEADLSSNVLLIDQPEDNLDNDAIRRLLIPALDRARLTRQIIVVTHNANIGVLGDPDQVVCCTFDGQTFSVRAGSITEDGMQSELLRVLEGAEDAFRDRASRYGITI